MTGKRKMIAFIRMHDKPDAKVECDEITIRKGARFYVADELCQFLVAITEKEVFHPVVDIEVM